MQISRLVSAITLCFLLSTLALAQKFTSIAQFDSTDGANPYGRLAVGPDRNFYGTTQFGGANGQGAIFKVAPSGALTTIYNFCSLANCADGGQPFAGLTLGTDGNFYGVTLGTIFKVTTAGQFTLLYTFCSQPKCVDGNGAYSPLALGTDGNFYGTTIYGGTAQREECEGGCGTIFKITPAGAFTSIYSFHGIDGYSPFGGLTLGSDGNFYGTASSGGPGGGGTVFKITSTNSFTLLHGFSPLDGTNPHGSLVQGTDGDFYGTTVNGGGYGDGVVFKITSSGSFTRLESFDGTNGSSPYAGLLQGADGNFYGVTFADGSGQGNCPLVNDCGTVFRITPSGVLSTLYNFCTQAGCPDGGAPFGGLTQGKGSILYGTTLTGGTACGADGSCGTVFRFSLGASAPIRE